MAAASPQKQHPRSFSAFALAFALAFTLSEAFTQPGLYLANHRPGFPKLLCNLHGYSHTFHQQEKEAWVTEHNACPPAVMEGQVIRTYPTHVSAANG